MVDNVEGMTTYIFSLSQEHPEIPAVEVEAVLNAENVDFEVQEQKDSLLFVEADDIRADAVDRLAMSFEVAELLHTFKADQYQKLATKDITTDKPFAVRKQYIDDTEAPDELESNVGRIINKDSKGHVNLNDPHVTFRLYLYDGDAYLCRIVTDIDRSAFEQRQNQFRPFSSPVSLHPRLARALVNLSEAPRDGCVLDPFCGTGGILLEASLIGCDAYGLDIQKEMVNGTTENLAAFHVDGEVRHGNFEDIATVFEDELPFDAVVTDLPYGKASKLEGDPTDTFLEKATELSDGKAVFMTNRDSVGDLEPAFEIYVHRSMSRYVYILD